MTNNIEKMDKVDSVHIILAVRRSKENEGQTHKDELCFREIIRGTQQDTINKIKARISNLPGTWRLYQTVNARDTAKATRMLMHELLDNFNEHHWRVDSLYKKMLLQTFCRKTKRFMLDLDDKSKVFEVKRLLESYKVNELMYLETPNGYHIIVEPFNLNEVKLPKEVTLVKDGYFFLEKLEIK